MTSLRRWPQSTTLLVPSLCVVLVAAAIIVFNGGISVGDSNHVGLIPVVRRLLDPSYLPGDFNIELRLYHHRVFAWILAAGSLVLGEDRAIITVHLLSIIALSASLYFLCRTIGLSPVAYLLIGLLLALNVGWTGLGLEENNFTGHREIQPPPLAHALVLAGTALVIRRQWRWAAVAAGLATLLHLQIGAIFTLLIAPFYALRLRDFGGMEVARLALCYLVPAAPVFLHFARMLERGVTRSLTLEYLNFRMPHHFAIASAEAGWWVGGHLLAIGAVFWWLARAGRREARPIGVIFAMCSLLALLILAHYADYYYFHWATIIKVQFPRLSPLITVAGAISIVTAIAVWNGDAEWSRVARASYAILFLIVGGYIGAAINDPERFNPRIDRYREAQSSWGDICRWIRANAPKDAIYLAPPARYGFTYLTDRSSVVEFKINPDGGQYLDEWMERLRDLCGGTLPDGRGLDVRRPIDRAYGALTTEQMAGLAVKYRASYAVVPRESQASFPILYENRGYRLLELKR